MDAGVYSTDGGLWAWQCRCGARGQRLYRAYGDAQEAYGDHRQRCAA